MVGGTDTANLPMINIMDFRGFDSSIILNLNGWNYQAHSEYHGKFESSNLSRDNDSRVIGRSTPPMIEVRNDM